MNKICSHPMSNDLLKKIYNCNSYSLNIHKLWKKSKNKEKKFNKKDKTLANNNKRFPVWDNK